MVVRKPSSIAIGRIELRGTTMTILALFRLDVAWSIPHLLLHCGASMPVPSPALVVGADGGVVGAAAADEVQMAVVG